MANQIVRGYELLEELGEGGFGMVYRAHQKAIHRDVAVKIIRPEYAKDADFITRFNREAEIVGQLEHPRIVPLYDYWHDDTGAYLVMRMMRGGSLRSRIQPGLDLALILTWFEQISEAVHTAHRHGIIHRDIKPENILLDEDDNAYLADFGIAKNIALKTSLTQNPFTPLYAAPEQFSGEPITPATDIYTLSVMLYEMLSGELPFGTVITELIYHHINSNLPELASQFAHIPNSIDRVLAKASSKAPEDRFSAALEFFQAFKTAYESPAIVPVKQATGNIVTNPFFHRGPIRDANYFFGRENETRQLLSLLQTGQSVSIIGQRRFGKTSLLYHMMDGMILSQQGLQADDYLMIYIDCGAFITLEQNQIYLALLEEIEDLLYEKGHDTDLTSKYRESLPGYRDFERSLRRTPVKDLRLVFIFDEFELLSCNANLESEFFTGLRALAMRHAITYITASKQPLLELTYADESALSSPFFNIFANIHLTAFSDEQAYYLLTNLVAQSVVSFNEEQLNHIHRISGANPLFLQIGAYHALELLLNTGTINPGSLNQHFRDDVLAHMEYYWRSLSHEEQYSLMTLVTATTRNPNTIHHLHQQGLIRRNDRGMVDIFSPIFAEFIAEKTVNGIIKSGAVIIDEARREVICYDNIIELSPLQYELLRVLITQPGQVLSNETLETALWQDDYVDDPERLKSVIKGLRRALGDFADHIENQRGIGYKWRMNL